MRQKLKDFIGLGVFERDMKRGFSIFVLLVAMPLFADTTLFARYEAVRQALLKQKIADVQSSAKALADAAKDNAEVAKAATAVANAKDIKAARTAFGTLSDELIKVRNAAKGDRPAIGFCPMVNKSWLQTRGEIGNPYDSAMAKCGILKD
jgi:hypothetical protein